MLRTNVVPARLQRARIGRCIKIGMSWLCLGALGCGGREELCNYAWYDFCDDEEPQQCPPGMEIGSTGDCIEVIPVDRPPYPPPPPEPVGICDEVLANCQANADTWYWECESWNDPDRDCWGERGFQLAWCAADYTACRG